MRPSWFRHLWSRRGFGLGGNLKVAERCGRFIREILIFGYNAIALFLG